MIYPKIAWCTGHYRTDFTKLKAKELREQGYTVSFGYYIKELGETYCKIYLERDLNYFILDILERVKSQITRYDQDIYEAIELIKDDLKKTCKDFKTRIVISLEDNYLIGTAYEDDKEIVELKTDLNN